VPLSMAEKLSRPDVARALPRHRAVLPHLGNRTGAIEFGCLKAGVRILTLE
jgi:hypothetical protein